MSAHECHWLLARGPFYLLANVMYLVEC